MSNHKIKKVKEFLTEGIPQFDVIARHDPGKNIDMEVISGNEELIFKHTETLAPSSEEGIIHIVKRISDDQVFHQSDMVEAGDIGSCFIVEFKEDLIHCVVVVIFEQDDEAKKIVEINQLTVHPQVDVGNEFYKSESNDK